ncbi:ERF family protein [Paraflavitalea pollutisoli]|uniref:ERF family protein n=1 Tax=Paraflavitalea pollutisoli TaxID=3034143 RepID=UPI0023EB8760|nr:ERF family protein [Paraflavitalea sp. H1-2-19X]
MDQKSIAKSNVQNEVPAPVTPIVLLEQAIAKGVDLDQLQKLMDLQDRWEQKQAKKAFLDALALFQTRCPVIPKKKIAKIASARGSYSYRFADLGTIRGAIQEALQMCGLSYRWEFKEANGKLKVVCLVSHRDGHTETTEMEAGVDATGGKNDIQQKGSTHTYLQRYTLIGALGLATADEDNDGETTKPGASDNQSKELTEEEMLAQWKELVKGATSRFQLTQLYLKNLKAVDADERVKAIFKARQEELPEGKTKAPVMP